MSTTLHSPSLRLDPSSAIVRTLRLKAIPQQIGRSATANRRAPGAHAAFAIVTSPPDLYRSFVIFAATLYAYARVWPPSGVCQLQTKSSSFEMNSAPAEGPRRTGSL